MWLAGDPFNRKKVSEANIHAFTSHCKGTEGASTNKLYKRFLGSRAKMSRDQNWRKIVFLAKEPYFLGGTKFHLLGKNHMMTSRQPEHNGVFIHLTGNPLVFVESSLIGHAF